MGLTAHDVLHAISAPAALGAEGWRLFVYACAAVFGLALAVLLGALWRAPRDGAGPPDRAARPGARRSRATVVASTVLGLLVLVVASAFTVRALARLSLADAVHVEVTAQQWWWSVRYPGREPGESFETANELRVPVGRPVLVRLTSADVVHSLWLPSLAGRKDLVPGRTTVLAFQAERPGSHHGQCAESCGAQPTLMALTVHADPPRQFEAWRQRQLAPATAPVEAVARRGQSLFESMSCGSCHTIQGTLSQGRGGPDLTHVASRGRLAAGTLPNTAAALADWIRHPQRHKPGTSMPATALPPDDLAAIVAYLGTLQ